MFARAALLCCLMVTPALGSASARPSTSELRRDSADRRSAGRSEGAGLVRVPDGAPPGSRRRYDRLRSPRSSARASSIRHRRRLPRRSPAIIRDRSGWQRRWPPASRPSSSTRTTSKPTTCSPSVYSAWADGAAPPPAGQTVAGARARAIEHLTAIQSTPLVATNPNLQMTLGRLQLRAGKADVAVPILEKVAQQVPWAAEPLVLLYEAQTTLGRIEEAGATLLAAAQINPRYWPTLGQFYERQDKWAEAAAAYAEAVVGHQAAEPRRADSYAAALINTDGRRRQGAHRAGRSPEGHARRHARVVSAVDGGANRRRLRPPKRRRAAFSRSIRPASPAFARSWRCCSSGSTTSSWPTWSRRS